MPSIRLDRMLSGQGYGTRGEIRTMLRRGAVTVNGLPSGDPGQKLDPEKDRVTVDGREVVYREHLYLMMNKPAGVISASSDPKAETVLDLLPPELRRPGLFPVGRLDKDTRGLLLITDDGALAHALLAPGKHVAKRYEAAVDGAVTQADAAAFRDGVTLDDGYVCLPAALEAGPSPSECAVTITEGKYHQIKRMFEARGKKVLSLRRISMGALMLDADLPPGRTRELTAEELGKIKNKQ